jgi:glycosyltransferase involved in cell wall biosynthesis
MQATIIVAAYNEGEKLSKTLASVIEAAGSLDYQLVIADDASTDGSIELAQKRFSRAQVVHNSDRKGASPTKALGASHARTDVLVFLDGHVKPEPGALERLVEDIGRLGDDAIVTPQLVALDANRWRNNLKQAGYGYGVELGKFDTWWITLGRMSAIWRKGRQFYESPALIGCAFAVHRDLYERLYGFDRDMMSWGVEDIDLGLKCWLMGYSILHDPNAVVGHRFQQEFENYSVPWEDLISNQLRMARKNLTQSVWSQWVGEARQRLTGSLPGHPEGVWALAWQMFQENRASVEQERSYLHARRTRDEFWYAERFGLSWPRLQGRAEGTRPTAFALAPSAGPSPSPSMKPTSLPSPKPPSPAPSPIPASWYSYFFFGGPGGNC